MGLSVATWCHGIRRGTLTLSAILFSCLVAHVDASAQTYRADVELGAPVEVTSGNVTLRIDASSWVGWATYDIHYFRATCTEGGQDCSDRVDWSTNYGHFEHVRTAANDGLELTELRVYPPIYRPQSRFNEAVVMWSSEFDGRRDGQAVKNNPTTGTLRVSYRGASIDVPLTAYSILDEDNPLPVAWNQPANLRTLLGVGFGEPADDAYLGLTEFTQGDYLNDPAYQQSQLQAMKTVSDQLKAEIIAWHQGNQDPYIIPESVFDYTKPQTARASFTSRSLSGPRQRWKLVRWTDVDSDSMARALETRPADPYENVRGVGARGLFPDQNTTYIRYNYVAPFDSTLILTAEFPHARFMSFENSQPPIPSQPTGTTGSGGPEVPITDADILPDPGSVNPFMAGADRTATNRNYTVAFHHPLAMITDDHGNLVDDPLKGIALNEQNCAGSFVESRPAYRCHNPSPFLPGIPRSNVRIAGNMRTGGGTTDGELLPAQLWLRYYAPDAPTGAFNYDPYGGVDVPIAYFEATWDGQTYRWGLELVRGPGSAINAPDDGEQRDRIVRFLSSPVAPNDPPLVTSPSAVGAGSAVGYTKGFHIPRAFSVAAGQVAQAQGGLLSLLLSDEALRELDAKAFGKGYARQNGKKRFGGNAGGVLPAPGPGTYESHSTASNAIHYTGRTLAIEQGYVAVFTGRAPTTPSTLGGDPIMTAGTDMRYWSFTHYCTGPVRDDSVALLRTSPFGGLNCGSLHDEQITKVTRSGDEQWYAIVLSQPEDRPALATRGRGFTWQDWGPTPVQPTGFRWMAIGERPGVDLPGEAWANYGSLGDTVANSNVIVPDIVNLPFVGSRGEGTCGNDWRALCAKSADPLAPEGFQGLDTSWSGRTRTTASDAFTFIGKNERTESVMKDYHPEVHYLTTAEFDALSAAEREPWNFGGGQYKTGW